MVKNCFNWRAWCRVLVCTVCIICLICSGTLQAQAAGAVRVSGSAVTAERGEEVTVTFSLSNNPGIWGMSGKIVYDQEALTLKSVSTGTVFEESEWTGDESLSKNPYAFLAIGNAIADKTSDGVLVTVVFTVNNQAKLGLHVVGLQITQAINANGDDVTISASAAEITLVECAHRNTTLKNAKEATEQQEGYTGDLYCTKCDTLVAKGETIPKLPAPTEPAPTEPKPTEPAPTEPKPTEPAPTEPKPTEPKPTEPAPTEPAPTDPTPTEPAPTEPTPTEPAPTEPTPTEPAPTEPAPTEPAPTEPDSTEPAPTEPEPPQTGDKNPTRVIIVIVALLVTAAVLVYISIMLIKRSRREEYDDYEE